jgi:hypothetical protein
LIVRKTSHVDGWATYRMFPLDAAGNRIAPAWAPDAFAATVGSGSSAAGLFVQLQINAGPAYAGVPYVVVGSVSGACPGIAVSGIGTLPVVYDLFAAYTLFGPLAPQTSAYQGALNASGAGTALVAVAPGAYPQLVGLTFTHAAAIVGGAPPFFTNPATFTVLP